MPTPARAMSTVRCASLPAITRSLIRGAVMTATSKASPFSMRVLSAAELSKLKRQLLAGGLLELRRELFDQRLGGVRAEDGEGLRGCAAMRGQQAGRRAMRSRMARSIPRGSSALPS